MATYTVELHAVSEDASYLVSVWQEKEGAVAYFRCRSPAEISRVVAEHLKTGGKLSQISVYEKNREALKGRIEFEVNLP